jgi:hypothetical protein
MRLHRHQRTASWIALGLTLLIVAGPLSTAALAEDSGEAAELAQIKREIQQIKAEEERQRQRDEEIIKHLQESIQKVEAQNRQLEQANSQAHAALQTTSNLQAETDRQLKALQEKVAAGPTAAQTADALANYWGSHQFVVTGGAGADFIYDRHTNSNTFALDFEPIILYRLNDWLLFEGVIEANMAPGSPGTIGSGASFDLPVATAQIFLNDYAELNVGVFDQPFGDFYEDQSAVWVNRFITAPLPYGSEALIPPTDIGIQLRGGVQWGKLGQDFDYTTWVANGPSYTAYPQALVGNAFNGVNNITVNTNGKAFGARFRFYPLPLDSDLGRLELGASTYDGKYQNSSWLTSWGVDFAYLRNNLQARGEYLQTYRQMGPTGFPAGTPDNRQGWYVQAGYFLSQVHLPILNGDLDRYIEKLEPLIRYSGVNQRAVVTDDFSTIPEFGFSGSPAIFAPHAREVALGLDYWLAPSIVWQTEFDIELPEAGGLLVDPAGKVTPMGATVNDRAILTQIAIGF